MKIKIKNKNYFVFLLPIIIFGAIFLFKPARQIKAQTPTPTELKIISRAEWGADETIRFWDPQYAEPKKFIIHHTVSTLKDLNGDSVIDKADYTLIVKSIYLYHSQGLGWGDIGYNYLVDPEGNIYEGRYGGDGVIGAHAYDQAKTLDFNRGTIGISLLGNYENKDTPTPAALNSIITLIANKASLFGIVPTAAGDFLTKTALPNIVGHRDVDATLCPGALLYAELPNIRTPAQTLYDTLQAQIVPKTTSASLIGQSDTTIQLQPNEEKELWVDFLNTGTSTWRSYLDNTVYLTSPSASPLKASNWLSETKVARASTGTANVPPGGTGRFYFKIKGPTDLLTISQEFNLTFGDQILPQTNFKLSAQIIGLDYAAQIIEKNILPASFINSKTNTTLKYQNIGLKTWAKDKISLKIYGPNDTASLYQDKSWPAADGQIKPAETEIATGQTASFTFKLKSPSQPGDYKQVFKLFYDGQEIVNSEANFTTRVDSHFKAELISQNVPIATKNVWRPKVIIKFKNTGVAVWDKNVKLYLYDLGEKPSLFKDRTWPAVAGAFTLQEKTVKPGEIGTFKLTLTPPKQKGVYKQFFKLKRPGTVFQNGEFQLLTRVD